MKPTCLGDVLRADAAQNALRNDLQTQTHLHTPCSPSQAAQLLQTIARGEQECSAYDTYIDEQETFLMALQLHKAKVEANTATSKWLLSPLRTFPSELLREIFSYTVTGSANTIGDCVLMTLPTLTLAHVCSRWRSETFACPSLWTNVSLEFEGGIQPTFAAAQVILEIFIQNSRKVPLDVSLNITRSELDDMLFTKPLISMLCGTSAQWRSCNITVDDSNHRVLPEPDATKLRDCLQPIRGKLRLLQELRIGITGRLNFPSRCFISVFKKAPKLRQVYLTNGTNPRKVQLPWQQLRCLVLDSCTPTTRSYTIGLCGSDLDSLTIIDGYSRSFSSSSPDDVMVATTHAQKLHVSFHRSLMDSDILENMSAPNLKNLHLSLADNDWLPGNYMPFRRLKAFIGRSQCKITTLTITQFSLTESQFSWIMSNFPSLIELNISHHRYADTPEDPTGEGELEKMGRGNMLTETSIEALDGRRCSVSDEGTLRNLERMSFRVKHSGEFAHSVFVECLRGRYADYEGCFSSRLQFARLELINQAIDKDIQELYQPLRDIGLQIELGGCLSL